MGYQLIAAIAKGADGAGHMAEKRDPLSFFPFVRVFGIEHFVAKRIIRKKRFRIGQPECVHRFDSFWCKFQPRVFQPHDHSTPITKL